MTQSVGPVDKSLENDNLVSEYLHRYDDLSDAELDKLYVESLKLIEETRSDTLEEPDWYAEGCIPVNHKVTRPKLFFGLF